MRASLNSLASNVSAPLVGALVEKGLWQPAQGLAYAQQAQNPWQRAECISAIVLHMPKAMLPEVLKTIGQIMDAVYRSYVLSKLAEQFPELWPEVLSEIQQIQDRYGQNRSQTQGFSYRGLALSRIVQYLPSQYLSYALDLARQIQDAADRVIALIALAEHLSELWPEVLSVTREIKVEHSRSRALSDLAEHLPAELWAEVLSMTGEIKDESSRSYALSGLAEYLPAELLREALESIWRLTENYFRAYAFQGFLPQLEKLAIPFVKWVKILDDLAYQNRGWLIGQLPNVRPILIRLTESDDGFLEILQVVREVCQQWP